MQCYAAATAVPDPNRRRQCIEAESQWRIVGDRIGAAAERRGTEADGIGRLAGRRRVVAFHVGTGMAVFAVAGLEETVGVVGGLADFLQLREVHRIGVLGAGGDMGDLAIDPSGDVDRQLTEMRARSRASRPSDAVVAPVRA